MICGIQGYVAYDDVDTGDTTRCGIYVGCEDTRDTRIHGIYGIWGYTSWDTRYELGY